MGSRTRGRPRSRTAEDAIIRATQELLAEADMTDAISIEAIAARAKVGKATIYRRWTDKRMLIQAALDAIAEPGSLPAGLNTRDKVEEYLRYTYRWLADGPPAGIVPALLVCLRDDPATMRTYVDKLLAPRKRVLETLLNQGIARRELRDDLQVDEFVDHSFALVFYCALIPQNDAEPMWSKVTDLMLEVATSDHIPVF
jgi:AcrR family transcriptional regulator